MNTPLSKKRLYESTTTLFDDDDEYAKKLKRTASLPQVIDSSTTMNEMVAKALILLKTSMDSEESQMEQWYQRCEDHTINPAKSTDVSSSSASSSNSLDELDDSTHSTQMTATTTKSMTSSQIPPTALVQQMLRSKSFKMPSNPDEFVRVLLSFKGRTVQYKSAASLCSDGYFPKITDEYVRCYTMEVVTAVRNDDVAALRRIHKTNPNRTMLCGSKFGDSIVHLACRRNCVNVLEYLLCELNISPQIVCDYGRTPLHDALWTRKPNERILALLLKKSPDLLFVTDHRGSTPLSYAPRDQWTYLCRFIAQHIKKHGTYITTPTSSSIVVHDVHVVPPDDPKVLLEQ
jgi:Ankyrin repeats (3 copies)